MNSVITVTDLMFSYSKSSKPALDGLSLTIKTGEFVLLVGSNGCGKSTLFKLIMGRMQPSSGKITKKKGLKIAYISQNIHQSLFMDLTVEENLILMRIPFVSRSEIQNYLGGYHKKLPSYFDQPIKMLSGGEKQALVLAIKLYCTPDVLLLDEHTSALDPEAEKLLMDITNKKITEQKITTLMCTHKLSHTMQYGTRIIGINKGLIIFDELNSKKLTKKCIEIIYE